MVSVRKMRCNFMQLAGILREIDLTDMPYNPTNEEIQTRLQTEKFTQEVSIKRDVEKLLSESSFDTLREDVIEIVGKISDSRRDELIHYIFTSKENH